MFYVAVKHAVIRPKQHHEALATETCEKRWLLTVKNQTYWISGIAITRLDTNFGMRSAASLLLWLQTYKHFEIVILTGNYYCWGQLTRSIKNLSNCVPSVCDSLCFRPHSSHIWEKIQFIRAVQTWATSHTHIKAELALQYWRFHATCHFSSQALSWVFLVWRVPSVSGACQIHIFLVAPVMCTVLKMCLVCMQTTSLSEEIMIKTNMQS